MSSLRLALKLSMADAVPNIIVEEKKAPKRKLSISEDDVKKKSDESSHKSDGKSTPGGNRGSSNSNKPTIAIKTQLEPILEAVVVAAPQLSPKAKDPPPIEITSIA